MATDPLDALHATPPAGFVAAREAAVRRLRDAGDAEAARAAAALRKPTPVVWALNQVARREPGAIAELLEATVHLRGAQLGDRAEAAAAIARQREALQRVVSGALARVPEAGAQVSRALVRRLEATALGAAFDPGAREDLRRGRLAREMAAPGFEAVSGAVPVREGAGRGERAGARERKERGGRERAEVPEREGQARDAERRRREAARLAASERRRWLRRARELEGAAAERRRALATARRRAEVLRRELQAAEEKVVAVEQAAEQLAREAREAREEVARAAAPRDDGRAGAWRSTA